MRLSDFDFRLPDRLIAEEPVYPRDASRLLILNRESGKMEHRRFSNLADYLSDSDILVFNDTKVFPGRLFGQRQNRGKTEILLISPLDKSISVSDWPQEWRAMTSPRPEVGAKIDFGEGLLAEIFNSQKGEMEIALRFSESGEALKEKIHALGKTPLPPYIKHPTEKSFLGYQTIYAKTEGSVAGPTAGFHFTEELMKKIEEKCQVAFVSLNVGPGTFLPVKTENIEEHKMHSEKYFIPEETAKIINDGHRKGKRIIAIGTTSCRALESAFKDEEIESGAGETNIFIRPGYKFKVIQGLVTNFHLPKSTLLMLACAFAGKEKIFRAYKEAIKQEYRFYSFGDAMFIH